MNFSQRAFSSKLLLFGEYTILNGSSALAIPYEKFSGKFVTVKQTDERLIGFFDYLFSLNLKNFNGIKFKDQKLLNAIDQGIAFKSNIKIGYGTGSSGALTAACFHEFFSCDVHLSNKEIQKFLAKMEGFFHGKSSGADALSIYLNRAIHIFADKKVETLDLDRSDLPGVFFLIDTGIERSTSDLVGHFLSNICTENNKNLMQSLFNHTNASIDASINGSNTDLKKSIYNISSIQYELFAKMIPSGFLKTWKNGLDSKDYVIKLLGAGGGGYLLGYTDKLDKVPSLPNIELINH